MKKKLLISMVLILGIIGSVSAQTESFHYDHDNSTTPQPDLSGNGNDGLVKGNLPTVVSGKYGDGWSYDDDGDYVVVDGTTNVPDNSDLSVSSWVKFDGSYSAEQVIIGKVDTSNYDGWELKVTDPGDGVLEPTLAIRGAGNHYAGVDLPSLKDGNYHLLTATYDKSTSNATFYINGSFESTTTLSSVDFSSPSKIHISSRQGGTNYIQADIDEPRVYSGVLNSSNVQNLYDCNSISCQNIKFDSVSTDPVTWSLNEPVNFSYSVTSSVASVSNVTLQVFETDSGTELKSETFSYSSSSISDTQTDWFTPTQEGNYTINFTAVNTAGNTTVKTLEKEAQSFQAVDLGLEDDGDLSEWQTSNLLGNQNFNNDCFFTGTPSIEGQSIRCEASSVGDLEKIGRNISQPSTKADYSFYLRQDANSGGGGSNQEIQFWNKSSGVQIWGVFLNADSSAGDYGLYWGSESERTSGTMIKDLGGSDRYQEWFKIEFKNIDFQNNKLDIYVNGGHEKTVDFLNNTNEYPDRLQLLANYATSGKNVFWDEIQYLEYNSPPSINSIECFDGSSWKSCTTYSSYNDQINKVRANITDFDNDDIVYANFSLKTEDENYFKFENKNASTVSGDYYIYDNQDVALNESGSWKIIVDSEDSKGNPSTSSDSWRIPASFPSFACSYNVWLGRKNPAIFELSRCV